MVFIMIRKVIIWTSTWFEMFSIYEISSNFGRNLISPTTNSQTPYRNVLKINCPLADKFMPGALQRLKEL
jgi:hypothetical protein